MMQQSNSPGWLFWLLWLVILSTTISLATTRIERAIRHHSDIYFCVEAMKLLPETPAVCDPVFGTDTLKGSAA
ncbi:hypothetical protein SAMN05660666_02518 [Novosphingobium aromaticivorans]|uniref:hypothetical protein n=1 Tax=Novosphingobium aromaticivorans TaxID=48935 RepID=UPI00003C80B2|nr:hypothetical protein [Novosphingobium aromaticivorans]SCY69505.1 hypothetical protein SAMN05660666_02518 [Novosphingobium aromaticivorans]